MPMPRRLGRLNRHVANPVVLRFAGRIPPLAVLEHRGRSSGAAYRTPILAFRTEDGFVIALVYCRETDWERNVLAANGCELVYRGARHTLTDPRLTSLDDAGRHLPTVIRAGLRLLRVSDCLHLTRR